MNQTRPHSWLLAALIVAASVSVHGVQIANVGLPQGVYQVSYPAFSLTAIDGTPPYTWSASGLPPGIALNSTGTFTGTPTLTGSYFPAFQVVDNLGAIHVVGITLDVLLAPVPPQWASRGLFGGSIRSLAISPNYTPDGTLFALSPAEIYRSVDGGLNWSRFLLDPTLPAADILDFDLSPVFQYSLSPQSEAQKTVLVLSSGRVYKSINHGASFAPVLNDPQFSCSAAAFSPNYAADATIWALCTSRLSFDGFAYRSQDRGANWSLIHTFTSGPYNFTDLAVSPNFTADQTLLLLDANFGNVHKSVNGGVSWTQTASLPLCKGIALSPRYATDQTVVVRGDFTGMQVSTNGGVSFSAVNLPTAGGSINGMSLTDAGAGKPPLIHLQGDQTNGRYTAMYTADLGLTFVPVYAGGLRMNACCGGNVFTFRNGIWLYGSEQGVDLSNDGGFSFAAMDKGIYARDYDRLSGNGTVVTAGLNHDPGWYKSGDTGQSWVKMPAPPGGATMFGQVPAIPPNYATDHVLFLGDANGLFRSTEGGVSFTQVLTLTGGINRIAFAPTFTAASGTMFVGTTAGLYRSTNGGVNFTMLTSSGSCPLDAFSSVSIEVSPSFATDQTVFHYEKGPPRLCKSVNGGTTWSLVRSGVSRGFSLSTFYNDAGANGTIAKLMFLVDDPPALLRSLDGGASFTSPTGLTGVGMWPPACSPMLNIDATVLLPTTAGVYRSADNGASFAPLGVADQLKPREATSLYLAPGFNGNLSSGSEAIVTARNAGMWRSTDGGRSFAPVSGFSFVSPQVNSIIRVPGGSGATAQLLAATGNQGVFRSDDGGLSFSNISRGLPAEANARAVVAPVAAPASPVTAVPGRGLWRLNGATWGNVSGATLGTYNAFGEDGTWIYAMRQDGVSLRSNTGGTSWVTQDVAQTNLVAVSFNNQAGPTIASQPAAKAAPSYAHRATSIESRPSGIAAINTAALWSVSQSAGPRWSVNSGANWTAAPGLGDYVLPGGLTWTTVTALGINPVSASREVLAGTATGLWRSTDGGEIWRNVSGAGSGLEASSRNFTAFATSLTPTGATDILIGATGSATGGVFLSGDGGEHWMQINQGFDPNSLNISTLVKTSCAGCPVQYYSGTYGSGVYTRTIPVNNPPAITSWCFTGTGCACGTAAASGGEGQAFRLCGANFLALPVVEFDGIPATGCAWVSSSVITCTGTPVHWAGAAVVRVRNTDTRTGYMPQNFTFDGGGARASGLTVSKSGNNAVLTYACSGCASPVPQIYRSQNKAFTLNVETYTGGATTYTNTGALVAGSNDTYFWSVE